VGKIVTLSTSVLFLASQSGEKQSKVTVNLVEPASLLWEIVQLFGALEEEFQMIPDVK
jgi:hypothetical protein